MRRIIVLVLILLTIACSASHKFALPAGEWKLKTLPGEDLSVLNKPITLNFNTANAKANGFAGCNEYFSGFTTRQSSIAFSGIGATKMFCQETIKLEDKFFSALGKINVFNVDGNKLQLLQDDLVLLEFEK